MIGYIISCEKNYVTEMDQPAQGNDALRSEKAAWGSGRKLPKKAYFEVEKELLRNYIIVLLQGLKVFIYDM